MVNENCLRYMTFCDNDAKMTVMYSFDQNYSDYVDFVGCLSCHCFT